MPSRRPKRRPQAREISYSASLSGWVSPVALIVSGLAIGQSSTEPIQRLPEGIWRPLLGVPLTQTAWAAALVGVGTCYESPVTETPGLQGCLGDHATGTVQDTGPACSRHDREVAWCRRMSWKGPGPPPSGFISQAVDRYYPDSRHYHNYASSVRARRRATRQARGTLRVERCGSVGGDEL